MSWKYGKQVADAIQSEWFAQGRTNGNRYLTSFNNFHNRRLYARGEQPVQKYKDELSINGDLSYLNLDWKPVPILSKFVDILANGISAKDYDIKAYAQDPESIKKRTPKALRVPRKTAFTCWSTANKLSKQRADQRRHTLHTRSISTQRAKRRANKAGINAIARRR